MRNIYVNILFLSTCTLITSISYAGNHPFKKVETCQYDYNEVDFCSKTNIHKYQNALKTQQPNFSHTYILLNIGDADYRTYTAIDTQTGNVYPLNFDIVGFSDENGQTIRPAKIQFNLKSSDLCIQGGIESYRNSYSNVAVCFAVIEEKPQDLHFTWLDLPKQLD